MSRSVEKLGSLVFSVLMVTSMFVGVVALGAGTAAAGNLSAANITANPSDPGATSTHETSFSGPDDAAGGSYTGITVDYAVGSLPADVSDVGRSDIQTIGVDRGNNNSGDTIDVDLSSSVDGVSSSGNGETLDISLDGTVSVEPGDQVILNYGNVTNPSNNGTSDVTFTLNPQSATDTATTSVSYSTSGTNETNNNTGGTNDRQVNTSNSSDPQVINAFEAPLPLGSTDNTEDAVFTAGGQVQVTNFTFDTSGNVTTASVNLNGGNNGDVSASTVEEVQINLLDGNGSAVAQRTVDYDQQNVTANFSGTDAETAGTVETVRIEAFLADPVPENETIDATFTLANGNATGKLDTLGNQTTAEQTGFVSGDVRDQSGTRIADANVTVVRDGGNFRKVVQSFTGDDPNRQRGDYVVEVPPGNYTISADKQGFVGSPSISREVQANRTTTANLVIRRIIFVDEIEVDPEEDTAFVGDNNSFTVTVFDQDGDELSGVTVTGEIPSDSSIEFVSTGGKTATGTSDSNGEVEFVVTSDTVETGTDIEFTATNATGGEDPSVTATKSFIQNGEGAIDGTVLSSATGEAIEDASVWAVLQDTFRQNTVESRFAYGGTSGALSTNSLNVTVGSNVDGSSFNSLSVDYSGVSGDVSNVDVEDISTLTVNGSDASFDISDVSASNNGQTLDITLNGNVDLFEGDEVVAEYSDVSNVSDGDQVGVTINNNQNNQTTVSVTGSGDFAVNDSDGDGAVFYRIVDNDTGAILDTDEFRVQTPNATDTTVRRLSELNTSNSSVGEGFVVSDKNGDNDEVFGVTRLADEDYYLQASATAPQNGDNDEFGDASNAQENFENVTDISGDTVVYEPTTDLRLAATEQRAEQLGANLVDSPGFVNSGFGNNNQDTDGTNENGDFKLNKLYTDNQVGVNYTVIGTKSGFNVDFTEVFVTEDGAKFTDGAQLEGLNLEPVPVEAEQVDITQIGTRDSQNGQTDEFGDQSDAFAQNVSRDGTIDVIEVETTDADGSRVNGTVVVEVEDNDSVNASASEQFNGEFVGVEDGDEVSTGEDTVTVVTGEDGVATLLLETDNANEDLLTNKTATLTNDRSATDSTRVRFVGVLAFERASISGRVTDTDDDPIPGTAVFARAFGFPGEDVDPNAAGRQTENRFSIEPDTAASPRTDAYAEAVDDPSDEFIVERQVYNTTSQEYETVRSATVTAQQLRAYDFEDFPGISVDDEFKLYQISGESTANPNDATYTFDPVPAIVVDVGSAETRYTNIRAVKTDTPRRGFESNDARASVIPRSSDDANVVIPIDVQSGASAAVLFEDQTSDGDTVTVEEAFLPEDGFVAIHNATMLQEAIENGNTSKVQQSVIGVTEYLEAGTVEDVTATLDINSGSLDGNATLVAMPHRDDPNDEQYRFPEDAGEDPPFFTEPGNASSGAVIDSASITVTGQDDDGLSVDFDNNGDNQVNQTEVLGVISAFNDPDDTRVTDQQTVLAVISAFNNGETWSSVEASTSDDS